jgi:hypothetical protein
MEDWGKLETAYRIPKKISNSSNETQNVRTRGARQIYGRHIVRPEFTMLSWIYAY